MNHSNNSQKQNSKSLSKINQEERNEGGENLVYQIQQQQKIYEDKINKIKTQLN
jgi:hypothetical protein